MLAMLGFHPIRRKNFAALEIGRSFVKIRDRWWIVLSAAETKEKRADERRVKKLLVPFIDRYLDQYRPVLLRPDSPPSALWLSSRHAARIADKYVGKLIGATTLSTVGVKLSPHLFRTSAASAAAIYGGENPHLGSAVLHHADPRVTEHYNRATSLRPQKVSGNSFGSTRKNKWDWATSGTLGCKGLRLSSHPPGNCSFFGDRLRCGPASRPYSLLRTASKASPRWRMTWNLSNKIAAFGACAAVARRNGRHISITARRMRPLFFAPSQT